MGRSMLGRVTPTTVSKCSNPAKSAGLVVKRQILGYRYRRDHQVYSTAAGFPACADDRSHNLAISTCRLHAEWNRVKLVLGPLQDVEPAAALHMLLIVLLLAGGSNFVRAS